MAVGIIEVKNSGRIVFELQRGEETTTRTIDIAMPILNTDDNVVQQAVDTAYATFLSSENGANLLIQPANWRDTNSAEEQWTTVGLRYEVVSTSITPVTPSEG